MTVLRVPLDEGLPYRLAAYLIGLGHNAAAVGFDYPRALDDRSHLKIAVREKRVVLTNGKDFGDLIDRDRHARAGVILFRLGYVDLGDRIARLDRVPREHAHRLDQLIVMTRRPNRVGRPSAGGI